MSHSTEIQPLAKLEDGHTLCTTPAQDKYFVVDRAGRRDGIDLAQACQLYMGATEIVWGKRRKAPGKKAYQEKPRSTKKWQRKMQEALDRIEKDRKSAG